MSKDHIQFYFEGDEYYESLWDDLRNAKTSIYIQIYILQDDEIGNYLKAILIAKSFAGVSVNIVLDGIGSYELSQSFIDSLRESKISVTIHHPVGLPTLLARKVMHRDHRKVILIDDKIGYLGGFNLHQQSSYKYFGEHRWRDTQIRVTGDWISHLQLQVQQAFGMIKKLPKRFKPHELQNFIITNLKRKSNNQITKLFRRYIKKARRRINITTAYFVPDFRTMLHLIRAAKRGVDVKIITSRDVIDVSLVNRANRQLMKLLIRQGVKIYCFTKRVLHAKTAFFDEFSGTVGSSNLNYRSILWDLEINAFFQKGIWIEKLYHQEKIDLEESRLITLDELKVKHWWDRFVDACVYLIVRFF